MSEILEIDDLGYVDDMRQRLGVGPEDESKDHLILKMSPLDRVGLIVGWREGDPYWVDVYKSYFESQGIYLTTNPDAEGII